MHNRLVPSPQILEVDTIKMGTRDRKSRVITVFTGCKYEAEAMLSRLTPDHYQQLPSLVTCPRLTGRLEGHMLPRDNDTQEPGVVWRRSRNAHSAEEISSV